jgi:phosphatidyl-myo-inositol dimannoside synthase
MKSDISILSYDYPPNDGGISRLTASFCEELHDTGHNVEVCTLSMAKPKAGLHRPDIPTYVLPPKKGFREIGLAKYILKAPKEKKIITTVWNPEATIAYGLQRKNLYILAHGNEVMPYPKNAKFKIKSELRKKVLKSARCVICNSRYTEQLVLNIDSNIKTQVLNPGVDYERFDIDISKQDARKKLNLPENKKIILSVSRVDQYKGHDTVLYALASLTKSEKNKIHYVIAGKGSYLDNLKKLAKSLNLNDHITWAGFVQDSDLPILYKASDLFILCTREDEQIRGVEGFGMVFLEAQAAGVAVIGTNAGGIPDAIKPEQGGWLIEQDSSVEVTKFLKLLIKDPELFTCQGILGRQRAQTDASWSNYSKQLIKILENY